jgi:signal transduction histidine kinase
LPGDRVDELKRLQQRIDASTRAATPVTVRQDGEARLANLLGQLNEAVTILEPDGTWVYTSEAGTRIMGYPKGYDIDGGLFALLHPSDVDAAQTALAEVLDGTRAPDAPIDLRLRDIHGAYHIFENVGINLVDHPVIRGVVITSRDVTYQRLAEAQARETVTTLKTLLANLRDSVVFVNDARRIVWINQASLDMLQIPGAAEELIGESADIIRSRSAVGFEDQEAFRANLDQLYANWSPVYGDQLTWSDGRVFERDYLPVPLEGGRRGHMFVVRDVTEQRAREQQRIEQERSLRAAMEEQNRALLELADMKSAFFADVSHELKTPLSSIVGFTELVLDEDTPPDRLPEFTRAIQRNAERLLRVVEDLLTAEKLESGNIELEPQFADAAEILENAATTFRPQAAAAQVDLHIQADGERQVWVDPVRIDQLLVNLLSNAIKFTPQGGKVTLRSHVSRRAWLLDIIDTGMGIPAEEQDRLFHRFYRGSNAQGKIAGTGLGLMICRSIVELHGGAISLKSAEGQGTTIRIAIPNREHWARLTDVAGPAPKPPEAI